MTLDRRQFLARSGLLGAGAGGALLGAGPAQARRLRGRDPLAADAPAQDAVAGDPAARLPAVAFEGRHQAGIVTPPPPAATFAALDLRITSRGELAALLQALTAQARFLTAGGRPSPTAAGGAPADSGTLGPVVPADGLTVTLGVGTPLFDGRFGLAARKPAGLFAMGSFPGDRLQASQCGGDLMLSICAGARDTVTHALRSLMRTAGTAAGIRWRVDGFVAPARPTGVPRNHFGFRDGIANPDVADPAVAAKLLWLGRRRGEAAWAAGGTYHVCRVIRMRTDRWDELPLHTQQAIVGRDRDRGAVLGAHDPAAVPDYAADPHGATVPLNAHIRLANPRTRRTESSRILRRSYNYDRGIDDRGELDLGLVFNCFGRDIRRQFEVVQRRLIHEPMARFVQPFGGGYFLTLPGVAGGSDWWGQSLLTA